ncbi:MAG: metal-dependent transcriptional regulator [Vicingaceae bacterium]
MPSLTEENYLKAIFVLNQGNEKKASTNAIADKMSTKASSVSDMLKRLNDKKLINYKKYQAAELTASGEKIAITIIRKHRLWEYFLVEKLKFGWDEVHDIAEQLEHIQSKELTNRLEDFLDYPTLDPHGDPIPNKEGVFPIELNETLSDKNENESTTIIGVKNHSTEFLKYLDALSIELGTKVKIKKINDFDLSQEIVIDDKNSKHISKEVADNLFVKISE